MQQEVIRSRTHGGAATTVSTNKVLRNTYALLSITLLFSAFMAGVSMAYNWPHPGLLITFGGYLGLLFLTQWLRNSVWGLASVFALTGFMGATLGPIVSYYVATFSNGAEIVMLALGGTGVVFFTMSGIALTAKRDFSFMGRFLMVGIVVAIVAMLGAYFFELTALSLAVSAMLVLLMSGLILWYTQQIINGGEDNYIMATVTLFVAIYNLFLSLLHLLGFGLGEE